MIQVVVWKAIYNDYVMAYLNLPFHEDTLKDWLWDILKDLKIETSNEKGTKKAILLDFDEVLARLKAMDNHATRNVLKQI